MSSDVQPDPVHEDVLVDVLTRTGESFRGDPAAAMAGVLDRGRRLRRRRTLTAVAGSVTALAVVGVAGGFVSSLGADRGAVTAASAATGSAGSGGIGPAAPAASGAPVTPAQLVAALQGLLPGTQVTDTTVGSANPDDPEVFAGARLDDGHGAAAVSISLRRFTDAPDQGDIACPDPVYVPNDGCVAEQLADGSKLLLLKGYEYPDKRVLTKSWRAVLTTTDGRRVAFTEWNAAQEKDAPVSRVDPPLDLDRLKALVTDSAWVSLFDRIPKPTNGGWQPGSAATPAGRTVPGWQAMVGTAKGLLPAGLSPADAAGGGPGFAHFTVDDGKGAGLVEINVADWSGTAPSGPKGGSAEARFANATVRADGTRVLVDRDADGDGKSAAGMVRWSVEALLTDGTRVAVSAIGGPNPREATRSAPALTVEQLTALATSPQWRIGGAA
ncbi:hypothetical protein [Kitasatospora camelliae]|uniref:LigA protein n=1 Tax=Kitasatospora camelliae TaxID=3156397 RepID=A0AAU8JVU1_9ACTN